MSWLANSWKCRVCGSPVKENEGWFLVSGEELIGRLHSECEGRHLW
jgi:hypothetical protein